MSIEKHPFACLGGREDLTLCCRAVENIRPVQQDGSVWLGICGVCGRRHRVLALEKINVAMASSLQNLGKHGTEITQSGIIVPKGA